MREHWLLNLRSRDFLLRDRFPLRFFIEGSGWGIIMLILLLRGRLLLRLRLLKRLGRQRVFSC